MNQVMINQIELDLILKELDALKEENERLVKQLKDAKSHIDVLKAEVAWAERGYTRGGNK